MKLAEHVDNLRTQIENAFDKQFARLGVGPTKQIELEKISSELHAKRHHFDEMLESHKGETGSYENAREKLIDELTFTLFNRIAALKVMESASLFPPIITKQPEHGGRSFGHKAWLEIRPDMRDEELDGIREYIKEAFTELGHTLSLYSKEYPYALLPDVISLNEIIDAFNEVEKDPQIEDGIWQSDDILGWLYESYNTAKKAEFKDSNAKTEYDKVSLQSQVYTPRWVVQFLVDNSLGKLYLEMYPESEIKKRYKIANAPKMQERKPKPLHEIKLIDPASGSGNFLLYAFDIFYELYMDQIENYGADYDEEDIPNLIIEKNLHGIDLDDRAIQLAQLGLYIKARKKRRTIGNLKFNVVSSDFFLPDYEETRYIFEDGNRLDQNQIELIEEIWEDLQYAYKFGSLIRLDEKLKAKLRTLEFEQNGTQMQLFSDEELAHKPKSVQLELFTAADIEQQKRFIKNFFKNLKTAVAQYAKSQGNTFLASKTRDAITFLELLTKEYDVATANPPYTDSADFGKELRVFIENNYKAPYKFHTNLYATFIKRCSDFVGEHGFIAMLHPLTFMYIKTFEDVRKYILTKTNINLLAELGLGGVFLNSGVQVDVCMYILEKGGVIDGVYFDLKQYKNHTNKPSIFAEIYQNFTNGLIDKHVYSIQQSKLKIIKSCPFIYWISDEFREKFEGGGLSREYSEISVGMQMPGQNEKYFRFPWEINDKQFYSRYTKGGAYNNWYGNDWLMVRSAVSEELSSSAKARQTKYGVSSSRTTSKGTSFRIKERETYVDNNTINVFVNELDDAFYLLGLLNSKVNHYIFNCLNPTVHVQAGDLQRAPIPRISESMKKEIIVLAKIAVFIKRKLSEYCLYEPNFKCSPTERFNNSDFQHAALSFFSFENHLLTQVLINESIINEKIFEVYELTENDKAMVSFKEGESIGGLPVLPEAREAYLADRETAKEYPLDVIRRYIEDLPVREFTAEDRETVESGFLTLYQGNNTLEEFCIRHQINPINVYYWFKQSHVIPQKRMHSLAMEFLANMIREILMEDEDGIIPLVANAGEKVLLDRIEDKFVEKGFSMAQYSNFDVVLGQPLSEYLNSYFFPAFSNHLKLFKRLPATPFIWHISSGSEKGFDCYIIIYKWSRDKLMRIRSVYIEHRERALINQQTDLADNNSAEAQGKKDKIFKQLQEIEEFKTKIDELLTEGYDPILDDGVGKNIAPLQQKKMIPYEVLNNGQLKKYLNADW